MNMVKIYVSDSAGKNAARANELVMMRRAWLDDKNKPWTDENQHELSKLIEGLGFELMQGMTE